VGRLIGAARILGERIAARGAGTRPAAAASITPLAASAAPAEPGRIPQGEEEWMLVLAHVAGRADVADMVHEDEPISVRHRPRRPQGSAR
jgi:hypothetical protein